MKIRTPIILVLLTLTLNSCKNPLQESPAGNPFGISGSSEADLDQSLSTRTDLISGTPTESARQDILWSFRPTLLTTGVSFSVKGLPTWAKLDPQTGEISGTPGQVEKNENITLTAKKDNTYDIIGPFSINVIGDPLKTYAWHLKNTGQTAFSKSGGKPQEDINLSQTISQGVVGAGVKIAISDNGFDLTHEDLKDRVIANASKDYTKAYPWIGDPLPKDLVNSIAGHGTSVAGLIAASGWNSIGSRGVAPEAQFAGFLYVGSSQTTDISVDQATGPFDIFNYSYGTPSCTYVQVPWIVERQIRWGVQNLRSQKGAIYVKAAGNEFIGNLADCLFYLNGIPYFGNSNLDGRNALPELIVVGALNADGKPSSYSSPGSNIWISAPGGEYGKDTPAMITTDLPGCKNGFARTSNTKNTFEQGDQGNTDCKYTSTMNGTSSATPVTSGSIALLLSTKPDLTWRDVKYILAKTATRIQPQSGPTGHPSLFELENHIYQQGWVKNAAGVYFHNRFGFGRINIDAALAYAQNYKSELGDYIETVDPSSVWLYSKETYKDDNSGTFISIPDNNAEGITSTIDVLHDLKIESVQVELTITHSFLSDLGVELTSPSGTKSILMNINSYLIDAKLENARLLTNAFLDEMSQGTWKLKVVDGRKDYTGSIKQWKIKINGHIPTTLQDKTPPDPVTFISHAATTTVETETPVFSWGASPSSDVIRYEYSVGSAPGRSDRIPWRIAGNGNSYQAKNILFTFYKGNTYYVNIRAVDKAENKSAVVSSAGWLLSE